MFYEPSKNNHGLPHNPFNALVSPRPIGWISTLSPTGVVNLAPYSFFNAVSGRPPIVMFSSSTPKHSRLNAEISGEFVANLATFDLRHEVVETSKPVAPDVSEAETAGLEMIACQLVVVPRVARAPIALECRYLKTVELEDQHGQRVPATMILGEVVGIHIDDGIIVEGLVDITLAKPLSRLGYFDYASTEAVFPLQVYR